MKISKCTDVKMALFQFYYTPLYTAHLWYNYTVAKMKKLQVAYNDALRILLRYPRWTSASNMFVTNNVPTFHALLRNLMYKFMCRLEQSSNTAIRHLTVPALSDTKYLSIIWSHWRSCLYAF